jgi:16S rRNA (cytosine1402-N4)-methyltransferase
MTNVHETVLLQEAVAALMTATDGVYVDGTFGRGGHSARILQSLSAGGRLIGFDKDPAAASVAAQFVEQDQRFTFYHRSFAELPDCLDRPVQGVLLDLGVSSPQLDDAERGFSFREDGPLDMRMDTRSGMTAAEWINAANEADIAAVLKEYGEERFARRIAAAIVGQRPFERTGKLASVIAEANPRWEKHKHPATRSFQAIRIFINRELEDLERLLGRVLECLDAGGRLVVISFHSLEDRIVKRFMRDASRGRELPRGLPVMDVERGQTLRLLGKAVRASEAEVAANPRARSAIMRVAEKLA